MKKVLGVALVAAILVAAFPTTASASLGLVSGSKNCVGGGWLRPCRAPMPPSSTGGNSNGTSRSGSGNAGTSQGGRGTLPPAPNGR